MHGVCKVMDGIYNWMGGYICWVGVHTKEQEGHDLDEHMMIPTSANKREEMIQVYTHIAYIHIDRLVVHKISCCNAVG